MLVAALENGTVIDHIPTGKLFTVANLLKLDTFAEPVLIGNNLSSNKIGKKGMIKIANRMLTEDEIIALGVEHREVVVGINVGDRVRITDGPMEGYFGTVEELDVEKERVRVAVSMFGRETPVDLDLDQVEADKE